MSVLGSLNGHLIGQFAASIAPVYFTFALGFAYCFANILKLDFVPAISVIIQYVCLPAALFLRLALNDPSQLDLKLLGADALSKLVPLGIMLIWWAFFSKLGKVQSLEWTITFFMLATLPNTVLIGDQILSPMFNVSVETQTTTIIFAQSLYWYNFVILMFEIREMFIDEESAENAIETVVDAIPVVLSEDLMEFEKRILASEEMEKSRMSWDMGRPSSVRESNRPSITWEQHRQSVGRMSWDMGRPSSVWESNRLSITLEQHRQSVEKARPSWEMGRSSWSKAPYNDLNDYSIGSYTPDSMTPRSINTPSWIMTSGPFMTPSRMTTNYQIPPSLVVDLDQLSTGNLERDQSIRSMTPSKLGVESSSISMEKGLPPVSVNSQTILTPPPPPPTPSMAKQVGRVMIKVVKRMLQVPLLYGSALGFVWSLNRWRLPSFMKTSIELCAEPLVGLAMIILGMVCYNFYKSERGLIPCGWKLLNFGFFLRFLVGPLVMWVCALAVNIHGYRLDYAILQVIVPQGSMTFALAHIYGCKLEVITPAIYVQMIVFVPFILADYALLARVH